MGPLLILVSVARSTDPKFAQMLILVNFSPLRWQIACFCKPAGSAREVCAGEVAIRGAHASVPMRSLLIIDVVP
jgi:hypothetical protein